MMQRPRTPRIPPLAPEECDEQQAELLAASGAAGAPAANIFATLARHPGLYRKWVAFGGKLLVGKLPARERELAVLRTGWRCHSEYEWGQHVLIGKAAGLTDEEVERIKAGPDDAAWDPLDAAILRAVDELHDDSCVSDGTWATLAARYDEKELIELVMLIGQYHLVSFALNSLGVQREEGVPTFDA